MSSTDKTKSRKSNRDRLPYRHQPNGLCVTIYDPYGGPVPKDVQEAAARSIQSIAQKHNLAIGLANA